MKKIKTKEYNVTPVIVEIDNEKLIQFNYFYERLNNTKDGAPRYKIILCGIHKGLEFIVKGSYLTINETIEKILKNELKQFAINEYNYIHNIKSN